MEENCIHIYLKFYEFEIHPDQVTEMLKLEPTKSGVAGEKFFIGSKKNKLEREYDSNWWEYKETDITKTKWQQNYVDDFTKRIIIPRVETFKEITSQGEGELALVPYYYGEWNPGFDFKLEILRAITDSGLVLDMDIYCLSKD